jgi:hypothetical protein
MTNAARQALFASPIEQFRFKLLDRQAKAMISHAKRMGKRMIINKLPVGDVKYAHQILRQYGVHPTLFDCALRAAKEAQQTRRAA